MELSIIPTNSSAFAGLSRYEKEIAQAQGAIRISTLNDSDLMNVALRAISLAKIKLGSKPLPEDEQKALTLVLMEDIASYGHLTLDEINLALKRGLNGEYNSVGNDVIFFSPSNFCGWVRKFIEQKNEVMRKVANAKVIEPAKPVPSDADQKIATINIANFYAQEMIRSHEQGLQLKWKAKGLNSLYLDIVRFGIYETSEEDKR